MRKRIVIFDLDGVIFDSTEHVLKFFLDWFPTLTRQKVHEMWAGNFDEELTRFKAENSPIKETPEQTLERRRVYAEKKAKLPVHEGMRELLNVLHHNGCILTVNTAALEKNSLPLLEHAGILNMFDFVATKKLSASKTEKLKLIAERYRTPPEEMIFVTDTLGDILEADLANVPTIAVTWGAHDISYFKREPHKNLVAIVHTVPELQAHLLTN